MTERPLYGLVAMFDTADGVLAAARQAREQGYRHMDAYTPFPVPDLAETLGFSGFAIRYWVLIGAILGAVLGYAIQYWTAVMDYPLNIGGKPLHSWPSFLLVTFEMAVLFGALGGFLGMLILNGLPRLHHPIFDAEDFQLESRDRFFLCIQADDPGFELQATRDFLSTLAPLKISEVRP